MIPKMNTPSLHRRYRVLIYNTKMVDQAPDSWNALWDENTKGRF
jgi:maltose-binding protein MalE